MKRKHLIIQTRQKSLANHGFTLVELLVAATVTTILVGLLLSVTNAILENFGRVTETSIRQGDSSFAIDQMVQDLEGLAIPNAPGAEALQSTPEEVNGMEGTWLTFLSTTTDDDPETLGARHTGATRSVSYRLAHQNPIDGEDTDPVYALYRTVGSARHTFEYSMDVDDLQEDYWDNLEETAEIPAPSDPTDIEGFLAGNVVAFHVRFLRADTSNWTNPGDDIRIGSDGVSVNNTVVDGGFTAAEVMLTVVTPTGMSRLQAPDLTEVQIDELLEQHGKTVVRRTAALVTQ